jgi:HTH-type transcriptional regulator/antitoxin HigA
LDRLSAAEQDYLEVLTDLIQKYESQWAEEDVALSPAELIEYLMAANALTADDLVAELGSVAQVNEFLSGAGKLNSDQLKRLASRFNLAENALSDSD